MQKPTREYAYKILEILEKHYPNARMVLRWGNNFELLVAIILSAQCMDMTVNKVTKKLFPKYREKHNDLQSRSRYEAEKQKIRTSGTEATELINFAHVPITELEQDIKSTGFYHNKAKNINAAANAVIDTYHGILPRTIASLTTIPGVGRKTANVFLGNAYHIYEGIAVDTHVIKQSQALRLTINTKPEKIEKDLMALYDKKDWFKLTYLLIAHGRNMRHKKSDRISCRKSTCTLCSL